MKLLTGGNCWEKKKKRVKEKKTRWKSKERERDGERLKVEKDREGEGERRGFIFDEWFFAKELESWYKLLLKKQESMMMMMMKGEREREWVSGSEQKLIEFCARGSSSLFFRPLSEQEEKKENINHETNQKVSKLWFIDHLKDFRNKNNERTCHSSHSFTFVLQREREREKKLFRFVWMENKLE